MQYQRDYSAKIEYYTKEINRISKEILYCHPKYVERLGAELNSRLQRLEYFIARHRGE
jgi:hypothetical protein